MRSIIESRLKALANSLLAVQYLLHGRGNRVSALDVQEQRASHDSASASDMHSPQYVPQASEAIDNGAPESARLESFLSADRSAGGARRRRRAVAGQVFGQGRCIRRGAGTDLHLGVSPSLWPDRPEVRYLNLGGRPDSSSGSSSTSHPFVAV